MAAPPTHSAVGQPDLNDMDIDMDLDLTIDPEIDTMDNQGLETVGLRSQPPSDSFLEQQC
jgi:hypothetical protein